MSDPAREPYWPYFCEENIWHRCGALPENACETHAVFISNAARCVRMARQRAGRPPDGLICWDYHVILLLRLRDEHAALSPWQVIDPDTSLPCPTPAAVYLEQSFSQAVGAVAPDGQPPPDAPRFRLIPAALYRRELRSNRRHMRDPGGGWRAPPPPWPVIGHGHNLDRFIAMDASGPGEVVTLVGLREWLGLA